ncbi:uncharacterized protein PG998_013852 [Apiospora kogelbergensis]|uniref:uncharacterized protein n=1 Tax=Apiospora kogelbergensis TaxID=1337665 RepID=UPI00312FDCE3
MDGPPDNPRICAIAKRISPLPPEIIAPIIADQQLHRVLELSLAPTAGPRLLWAIKNSLQWKWLFVREDGVNQIEEFRKLFQAANFLSWIWCRQVAMQIPSMARRYHLDVDSRSKATSLEQLQQDFLSVFLNILPLPGDTRWRLKGLRHAELESITRFLPRDILTRIESSETPENVQMPSLEECMRSKESMVELTSAVIDHKWTAQQAQNFLPSKEPFAPQDRRESATQHTLDGLRRDAQRMLNKPICTSGKISTSNILKPRRYSCRFRYPHPALVPADWVLRLICTTLERYPLPGDGDATKVENEGHSLRYPPELIPDLRQCIEGMPNILQYTGISKFARYRELGANITHVSYLKKTEHASPHCYTELDWLEALLRCVSWVKSEAPELVQECLKVPADKSGNGPETPGIRKNILAPVPDSLLEYEQLLTQEDYEAYIAGESAEVIAQQLRLDSSLGSGHLNQLPSLLALYLPRIPTERARDIAACLLPGADRTVREVMYQDMVKKAVTAIRRSPDRVSLQESMGLTLSPVIDASAADLSAEGTWGCCATTSLPNRHGPAVPCVIATFAKWSSNAVTRYSRVYVSLVGSSTSPGRQFPSHPILSWTGKLLWLLAVASTWASTLPSGCSDVVLRSSSRRGIRKMRLLGIIMRATLPSGESGSKSLVPTSGRPAMRSNWWSKYETSLGRWGVLHILINNAAQTLTDSREKEQNAVSRERLLKGQETEKSMLITHSYEPRVRGVTDHHLIESASAGGANLESIETANVLGADSKNLACRGTDSSLSVAGGKDGPSSWVQTLADIPYEDVISAHSVNTFVPLILIRELMPLMKHAPVHFTSGQGVRGPHQPGPGAYIVNVSSREGIFERSPKSASKNGKHVHTNMSKAGLNMITETEAYTAWRLSRVAMNTVDPGYMSAAPECEQSHGGERPIGWEDGAGRVLWPIAIGEKSRTDQRSEPIWGRFLKHYGATRVDVRLGRG